MRSFLKAFVSLASIRKDLENVDKCLSAIQVLCVLTISRSYFLTRMH